MVATAPDKTPGQPIFNRMLQRIESGEASGIIAWHSAAQLSEQQHAEIEKINLRLQRLLDSFLDELIGRETFTAEKAKLMSRKKSLQEHSSALMTGRADWLEPRPRQQKGPWLQR